MLTELLEPRVLRRTRAHSTESVATAKNAGLIAKSRRDRRPVPSWALLQEEPAEQFTAAAGVIFDAPEWASVGLSNEKLARISRVERYRLDERDGLRFRNDFVLIVTDSNGVIERRGLIDEEKAVESFQPSPRLVYMVSQQLLHRSIGRFDARKAMGAENLNCEGSPQELEDTQVFEEASELITRSMRQLLTTIAGSFPETNKEIVFPLTRQGKFESRVARAILFRVPIDPDEHGRGFLRLLYKELIPVARSEKFGPPSAKLTLSDEGELAIKRLVVEASLPKAAVERRRAVVIRPWNLNQEH